MFCVTLTQASSLRRIHNVRLHMERAHTRTTFTENQINIKVVGDCSVSANWVGLEGQLHETREKLNAVLAFSFRSSCDNALLKRIYSVGMLCNGWNVGKSIKKIDLHELNLASARIAQHTCRRASVHWIRLPRSCWSLRRVVYHPRDRSPESSWDSDLHVFKNSPRKTHYE